MSGSGDEVGEYRGRGIDHSHKKHGPSVWPPEWGSESDTRRRVLGVLFAVVVGFVAVTVVFDDPSAPALVLTVLAVIVAVMTVLAPRRRKPGFSNEIRVVTLDPATGAISGSSDTAVPAGSVRGMVVPYDSRAQLYDHAVAVSAMLCSVMIWALPVPNIVAALVMTAVVLSAVYSILGAVGDRRNSPKVVCTPPGLWVNDRGFGAFVPWDRIALVTPVSRARLLIIEVIFVEGYQPQRVRMRRLVLGSMLLRRGRLAVNATPLVLDAALLCTALQVLSGRADMRPGCDDPSADGTLETLRGMYEEWHAERQTLR